MEKGFDEFDVYQHELGPQKAYRPNSCLAHPHKFVSNSGRLKRTAQHWVLTKTSSNGSSLAKDDKPTFLALRPHSLETSAEAY